MTWFFPLRHKKAIPAKGDPGAFGTARKHDTHTGVDLYSYEGAEVFAVESGVVVGVECFTGPGADSPWWLQTFAVLVEGRSGVVLYGELGPPILRVGDSLYTGQYVGAVSQVLAEDKGTPTTMLHLELYTPGTTKAEWWREQRPENLRDPTALLVDAFERG